MSKSPRHRALWILPALLLAAPVLSAGPLNNPKRMVEGQTVNLTPLVQWWTKHNGPRPLPAWGEARGPVVGTNSMGWIVQGQFKGALNHSTVHEGKAASGGKFILKNPPLSDRAEFDRLLASYNALESQRGDVAAQESRLKGNVDEIRRERRASGGHVRGAGRAAANAQHADAQAKAQLKTLDAQIAEAQKKLAAYPNASHYEVDCLAIDLGRVFQGLPVYDYGVPLN